MSFGVVVPDVGGSVVEREREIEREKERKGNHNWG